MKKRNVEISVDTLNYDYYKIYYFLISLHTFYNWYIIYYIYPEDYT